MTETYGPAPTHPVKKLYRSRSERVVSGVAGGIAEYAGIDPNIVRLLFVILSFAGGGGLIAYLVAWMLVPERPE